MLIELSYIISIISVTIAAAGFVVGFRRNSKQENIQQGSQMAQLMVKLENISDDLKELKAEFRNTKEELDKNRERTIILERDMKSLWTRFDEHAKKIENLEKQNKG